MNLEQSQAWRPGLGGSSWDILPYYRGVVPRLPRGAACVELGVAYGRSAIFLASELVAAGNAGARVYAVDPWPADYWNAALPHPPWSSWASHASNSELAIVCPLRLRSEQAARCFDPRSLDFVFVDAEHTRDGCAADIRAFLPLVKSGGILAGHDYGDFEQRMFGGPTYPGVAEAVHELVGRENVTIRDSIWEYKVS